MSCSCKGISELDNRGGDEPDINAQEVAVVGSVAIEVVVDGGIVAVEDIGQVPDAVGGVGKRRVGAQQSAESGKGVDIGDGTRLGLDAGQVADHAAVATEPGLVEDDAKPDLFGVESDSGGDGVANAEVDDGVGGEVVEELIRNPGAWVGRAFVGFIGAEDDLVSREELPRHGDGFFGFFDDVSGAVFGGHGCVIVTVGGRNQQKARSKRQRFQKVEDICQLFGLGNGEVICVFDHVAPLERKTA